MKRFVVVQLILAGGLVCFSGSAVAAALEEELAGLLQTHPGIIAADKTVAAAHQEVDRANGGYLPRIDLLGDLGPETVDLPTDKRDSHDNIRQTAGIAARENLFNGFRTSSQVRLAEIGVNRSEFELARQTQQYLFEGIRAYVNVLRAVRLIDLALGNEENIKHQLNLEDERVRRGAGIAVDVLQAKSRLQFAKERRVAFEGQLAEAAARYRQVYGHGPDLAAMADPMPPLGALPETLEQAIEIALRENPAVVNAAVAVDEARAKQDLVRADYYPTLDLVGSWNLERNKEAVAGTRRDAALLLQAQWNIFNGFQTQASETRAIIEHSASKDRRLQSARAAEEDTRIAWESLVTSRERVALLENAVDLAAEVFDARRRLRQAGKETAITVLDAENEVYSRRIDYTAASYESRLAVYRVLLAIGRLQPKDLGLGEG